MTEWSLYCQLQTHEFRFTLFLHWIAIRIDPFRFEPFDEVPFPTEDGCYPLKWRYGIARFSTCNEVHAAISLDRTSARRAEQSWDVTPISHGSYRQTWMLTDAQQPEGGGRVDEAVLKMYRLREGNNFKSKAYFQTQNEVLCMLLTHSSKRTMDIYQYCGASTIVEPGIPIESDIIPYYGWSFLDLHELQKSDVRPMNNLTPVEKLNYATNMAESIALLHGNSKGAIVSHDIGFDQYLRSKKDGRLKLNDCIKASVLYWNPNEQRSCKFYSSQSDSYRAPEEINGGFIDESADVVALAKFFCTILTGMRAYNEKKSSREARKAALLGELPYVDPMYRNRSLIESRIVDIMERMWPYAASERVDIFTVLTHLYETARLANVTTTNI